MRRSPQRIPWSCRITSSPCAIATSGFDARRPMISPKAVSFWLCLGVLGAQTPPLRDVTINFATRTGTTWPLYIAQEGGYFEKYGMRARLVFAVHPGAVAMIVSGE